MKINLKFIKNIHWEMLIAGIILTTVGIFFIKTATTDIGSTHLAREAKMQIVWFALSLFTCFSVLFIPTQLWKDHAWLIYASCILMQFFMFAAAGTPLVREINGACNWITIGSIRSQPSEFYKLGVLCTCAKFLSNKNLNPSKLSNVFKALMIAGIPSLLLAKEDLGSALTFLPMILGMLILFGMRLKHLLLFIISMMMIIIVAFQLLPKNGYQYKRVQAWLHPEAKEYALTTGYQTIRTLRSIGSGGFFGKGYDKGDLNKLGRLPEKHTDMIFGVIGEETGFVGSVFVLVLLFSFAFIGLYTASKTNDLFCKLLIGGFVSLFIGQVCINISVALNLMPVTGISLPFFSYGGSNLLAFFIGIGMCLRASSAKLRQFESL